MDKIITKIVNKITPYLTYLSFFVGFLLFVSIVRNIQKINSAGLIVKQEEEKLAKIEEENRELEKRLSQAKDEYNIEKQIRDKLGLAKEGEIVVILPPPEVLRKFAPEDREEEEVLPDPNWKKWARLFGF